MTEPIRISDVFPQVRRIRWVHEIRVQRDTLDPRRECVFCGCAVSICVEWRSNQGDKIRSWACPGHKAKLLCSPPIDYES